MTSLDDRIKQALAKNESEQFQNLDRDLTTFQAMRETFRSKNSGLVTLVYLATFIMAGLMFWCAYLFLTSSELNDRVTYGFLMLVCVVSVIGKKTWVWMEMNRVTLMRELRRMELQLARLAEQQETK